MLDKLFTQAKQAAKAPTKPLEKAKAETPKVGSTAEGSARLSNVEDKTDTPRDLSNAFAEITTGGRSATVPEAPTENTPTPIKPEGDVDYYQQRHADFLE